MEGISTLLLSTNDPCGIFYKSDLKILNSLSSRLRRSALLPHPYPTHPPPFHRPALIALTLYQEPGERLVGCQASWASPIGPMLINMLHSKPVSSSRTPRHQDGHSPLQAHHNLDIKSNIVCCAVPFIWGVRCPSGGGRGGGGRWVKTIYPGVKMTGHQH